jgi:prepilin-type N-terminal cleavage/methylation domain-containing protein
MIFGTQKENKNKHQGLTLVEILVAVFILTVGILSCFLYFSGAMNSTGMARDLTIATTHAEYVLEDMRARATLAEITAEDWSQWAKSTKLNVLPQETIKVTFADLGADPLPTSVTVQWIRKGRSHSVNLQTELTK